MKAARKVYRSRIPIMGINLGNLGYLTEVDRDNIDSAVEQLMEGRFEIEKG